MQDKDKKILQLRNILAQAKDKINELKIALQNKDQQIQQVKQDYQKKIKNLHQDEGQIMKQYEQRLIRYQKSLEDSDNLVNKYQKLSQTTSQNYQNLLNQLANISNLMIKNFTLSINKDHNEAVQQLCNIEKCKDFEQTIKKIQIEAPDLNQILKSIKKLSSLYEDSLKKKRQARLLYLKKQTGYQKQMEDKEQNNSSTKKQILKLKQEIKNMADKYQKQIQTIAKSKAKASEQKINVEFVKQLFIKVLHGPKQATLMAFEVLSKVLKFSPQEYISCIKKIK